MDMQDHKFRVGEQVDLVSRKIERVSPLQVEVVLDEMISAKYLQAAEGYSNTQWLATDTDKFLPGQTWKNLYRVSYILYLTFLLEQVDREHFITGRKKKNE